MADDAGFDREPLFDNLTAIRSIFARLGGCADVGRQCRPLWDDVYKRIDEPLLVAARSYAFRHHITAIDPADALSEVMIDVMAWVAAPGGAPIPAFDAAIMMELVQRVELRLASSQRRDTRHAATPLSLNLPDRRKRPQPLDEADTHRVRQFLVAMVRGELGEVCADALALHLDGHTRKQIAKQLGLSLRTLNRRLAEALAVARNHFPRDFRVPGKE